VGLIGYGWTPRHRSLKPSIQFMQLESGDRADFIVHGRWPQAPSGHIERSCPLHWRFVHRAIAVLRFPSRCQDASRTSSSPGFSALRAWNSTSRAARSGLNRNCSVCCAAPPLEPARQTLDRVYLEVLASTFVIWWTRRNHLQQRLGQSQTSGFSVASTAASARRCSAGATICVGVARRRATQKCSPFLPRACSPAST